MSAASRLTGSGVMRSGDPAGAGSGAPSVSAAVTTASGGAPSRGATGASLALARGGSGVTTSAAAAGDPVLAPRPENSGQVDG